MTKVKAIMKYMGGQERLMWHGIKWTPGHEETFTAPEDILAVRRFMDRPDVHTNWDIRIVEEPIIGPGKTTVAIKTTAPPPPPPPPTKEETDKAKDILDEVIAENKPKRNYTFSKKKR
jgi:hypothetical protein